LARKEIQQLRIEEMQFLGMMRPPKTAEQLNDPNDPIVLKEKTERDRKEIRD
jgi:hypothetical protein